MKLAEALKSGLAEGIPKPERHIETWLSDVFLYENTVCKVTKYVSDKYFGDLTNSEERKQFYFADFAWNNLFSPEIYISLQGLRENENGWVNCDSDKADDFYILMNRINADDTFINRLWKKEVTKEDVVNMTEKLLKNLDVANEKYFKDQSKKLGKGIYELMLARLDNFREFSQSAEGVSKKEASERADALVSFYTSHSYFKKISDDSASVTIDGHSANIVFVNNEPVFMDVYWPMPMFRIVDRVLAVSRIAACVRVFAGDELADDMYKIYEKNRSLPPREVLNFYETYNALVMGYYFTHIKRPELVQSYFDFADKNLTQLKTVF